MKDDFISMASHELRTPVTGIKGYVSMILDGTYGQVSDQVKTSLSIVENATDRLAVLVDDLLNVSRIEQGRIKITMEALNIAPIVKEIITELSVQAVAKKLELVYNPFQENFPPINIDPERLKQILINLIGNAIKYTPKGRVEVIIAEKSRGKTLEIKIKDTGIGMSAKDREKLFQKFYRVQNAATKEITGTGLGLWITKQLVELMGGTIMVDSMENSGTQFTIEFPVAKKQ
jgi:signal transduction histidine kinase